MTPSRRSADIAIWIANHLKMTGDVDVIGVIVK
jgi:hypothetical protein